MLVMGKWMEKKLEELMLAFMEGEFDVLVATTIIESGLDVPNANTILLIMPIISDYLICIKCVVVWEEAIKSLFVILSLRHILQ